MKKLLYGISGGSLVALIVLGLISFVDAATILLSIPSIYINYFFQKCLPGGAIDLGFGSPGTTICPLDGYDQSLLITNMVFYFIIGAFIGLIIGVREAQKSTFVTPLLVSFALLTTILLLTASAWLLGIVLK